MEEPLTADEIMLADRELDERQRATALIEANLMARLAPWGKVEPEGVVARAEAYLAFLKGGSNGQTSH